MKNKIRCFIAIPLDKKIQSELIHQMESLKIKLPYKYIRWLDSKKLHLTLKFLGNVGQQTLECIYNNLQHTLSKYNNFLIDFSRFGWLPSTRHPRVLCVFLILNKNLGSVYHRVEEICTTCGLDRSSTEFKPHITIARNTCSKIKNNIKLPELYFLRQPKLEVTSIVIYSSTSYKGGAIYTLLKRIELKSRINNS